jgi:hypothetical protein
MTIDERFERLRESYRPSPVRALFIGESRPANGSFFYAGNSRLSRYTQQAFSAVYGSISDPGSFLDFFRDSGCYLIDACKEPVNNLPGPERAAARTAGEDGLASAIAELQPKAIIVVMKAIKQLVTRAVSRANLELPLIRVLPFPAQNHEREYVSELVLVLRELKAAGLLGSD